MDAAARNGQCTTDTVLFMAMELSDKRWKLAFSTGPSQKPRLRTGDSCDLEQLLREIAAAKRRFGLPEDCRVVSCYEAGRDGFWIHRYLLENGVENHVVDPGSIERPSRKKQRKTDRLDVRKLIRKLIQWFCGDDEGWSVVQVPSVEDEDARLFVRELDQLKRERTQHTNRMKSMLVLHGIRVQKIEGDFVEKLESLRTPDGLAVPPQQRALLAREFDRLQLVRDQIAHMEKQRREATRRSNDPRVKMIRNLQQLRGVGEVSSWALVLELFAWREFRNRQRLASYSGLTPAPWDSGNSERDQGIDKVGNASIRRLLIELAWQWVYLQPHSELTKWFWQRYGGGNKKQRKVGIVAVARKLLIALWHYLDKGAVPKGAVVSLP